MRAEETVRQLSINWTQTLQMDYGWKKMLRDLQGSEWYANLVNRADKHRHTVWGDTILHGAVVWAGMGAQLDIMGSEYPYLEEGMGKIVSKASTKLAELKIEQFQSEHGGMDPLDPGNHKDDLWHWYYFDIYLIYIDHRGSFIGVNTMYDGNVEFLGSVYDGRYSSTIAPYRKLPYDQIVKNQIEEVKEKSMQWAESLGMSDAWKQMLADVQSSKMYAELVEFADRWRYTPWWDTILFGTLIWVSSGEQGRMLGKRYPLIADDQNSFPDVTDHFLYSSTDEYENKTVREPFLDGIVSDMDDYFKDFFNNYLIYVNQYGSSIAINADEYGDGDYELLGPFKTGNISLKKLSSVSIGSQSHSLPLTKKWSLPNNLQIRNTPINRLCQKELTCCSTVLVPQHGFRPYASAVEDT